MEPFDIAVIGCASVIVALIVLICLCRGVRKKKEQKRATILSGRTEQKRATILSGRTYGGAAERGDGMASSGTSGDGMAFPTGVAIAATAALTVMSSDLDGGGHGNSGDGGCDG